MNIQEQFAKLDTLIDRADISEFNELSQDIADFRDAQDVVDCEEGDDCICQRFDLARDAVDAENSAEAVKWLKEAKQEFIDAVNERIEHLKEQLQDDEMEHHEREGTIEVLERLEAIVADA